MNRWMLGAAATAGALLGAYAFLVEPHWVEWNREELAMPGLAPEMDGFRLCHLSDLHIGRGASDRYLEGVVRKCNQLKPDLVVVTGDLTGDSGEHRKQAAALLSQVEAKHGVAAILGGHDFGAFFGVLIETLRTAGVTLLRNEAREYGVAGRGLWIGGLDDNSGRGRPDLTATLKNVPPGAALLMLIHSPDSIYQLAALGVPLALAGHTHGGQVCLPFYGPVQTMSQFGRKFARGRIQQDQTVLYVSRGLGSHHHVRFLARPEVILWTLRAAPARHS